MRQTVKSTPRLLPSRTAGQAMLPVLLIMLTVLVLGAAGLHLSLGGLMISRASFEGERVLVAAEGALENGLLRLLRQPNYAGETLQVAGFDCTIAVSGEAIKTISGVCQSPVARRGLQASVSFINGEMVVSDYEEIL